MLDRVRSFGRRRFHEWLNRRIPVAHSVTLTQRRIFIFPNRVGLAFLVLIIVMLSAAINFENNLAFALTFLLISLFVVGVLHTYANLSGLTLTAGRAGENFVGDPIPCEFVLSAENRRQYFDVSLSWPDCDVQTVSLTERREQRVTLNYVAEQRGRVTPPRLLLETQYPLGFLRAWSWLAIRTEGVAFPQPREIPYPDSFGTDGEEGSWHSHRGSDEFFGFTEYRPGDPQKHLYWRGYARGQPLHSKQFAIQQDQRRWLDWAQFTGGIEQRLSYLCHWVLVLDQNGERYGLRLPGKDIAPGNGPAHRRQVLRALALFDERGDKSVDKRFDGDVA